MNIRHFFVTDQAKKGNVTVQCCPTDQMIADHFTKPLTGTEFQAFWKTVVNQTHQCEDTGATVQRQDLLEKMRFLWRMWN